MLARIFTLLSYFIAKAVPLQSDASAHPNNATPASTKAPFTSGMDTYSSSHARHSLETPPTPVMSSKKRKALLTSRRPRPAKKPAVAMLSDGFPIFSDGNVEISLGDLKLKLHSQKLSDTCSYFAAFTKFPERFALVSSNLSTEDASEHTLKSAVVSAVDPENIGVGPANGAADCAETSITTDGHALVKRARAANEAVFRILYQQPFSCNTPADFRDTAALATHYGCINAVQDVLVTAILKASLGTTFFQDDPCALLTAACILKDESIFSEAMVHVVGCHSSGMVPLPDVLRDLVVEHIIDLELVINTSWTNAMRQCLIDTVPRALATAQVRAYFDQNLPCSLGNPRRPEVYKLLAALHHMDDFGPLMSLGLMCRVDSVDAALSTGHASVLDRGHGVGNEDYRERICKVSDGLLQQVKRADVESEMRSIVLNIKQQIEPLFAGDRNAGYFTCRKFTGPFPWQTMPSSSSSSLFPPSAPSTLGKKGGRLEASAGV